MENYHILIRNGRVWNGERFLDGKTDIGINDGKIAAIGHLCGDAGAVFDADGLIVSPGLVDIHTHMKGVSPAVYGFPAESICFPCGVTAAAEADAVDMNGPAALDNMLLQTRVFVAVDHDGGRADFTQTEALLSAYQARAVGVKLFFDASVRPECGARLLRSVCAFARERGLRLMVHTTGSPLPMRGIVEALRRGDIISHIYHGGCGNAAEDGFACMAEARARGIVLDTSIAGGVHIDFDIAARAIREGALPDTISSDVTCISAFKRGGNYGLPLVMSAMKRLGMREEDVLRAATSSAARAIGLDGGLLTAGGAADLCVLTETRAPFDMTDRWGHRLRGDASCANVLTIAGGRVVYRSAAI